MGGIKAAAVASVGVLVIGGLTGLVPTPASADDVQQPDSAQIGDSADSAAGSCWEIKQVRPDAEDGAYWLLTPDMAEPQRFYCDMTTDGGGWVLVGKGRNGWTDDQSGRGRPDELLTPDHPGRAITHQLSAATIDHLLGGDTVADLPDGIRLRRAADPAGTQWQEVRFRPGRVELGWTWSFGGGLPLDWYSFDGAHTESSLTTRSFGTNSADRRVITRPLPVNGYDIGFAYGGGIVGSDDNQDSYLYSRNGDGNAVPFSLLFLRPEVTSGGGFGVIPDAGTPALERRALPESEADDLPWAVTGIAGSSAREGNVEVQAFAEAAGRMYVGGNFRYVQRDASGAGREEQPFLAAFDVDTGAWISTFRPDLNEQVRALEVLPNGSIVAAGDFSEANGEPATAIVALDPVTGETDQSFDLTVENRLSAGVLRIWSLQVSGDQLYLGGEFTHLEGGGHGWSAYMRNLGRVLAADGTTSTGWNPELNGTVRSIDATQDGERVYAAGYFSRSLNTGVESLRAAAVATGGGAPLVAPWVPEWSSSGKDYQQAIGDAGGHVWVGGSEHSLFSFSATTLQRANSRIMDFHGDLQAIDVASGVAYGGCHCTGYAFEGAANWPRPDGWHSVYSQNWAGAWDSTTGQRLTDFSPHLDMRLGSGIWAITTDSNGRLWVGGDITTVRSVSGRGTWSPGFARFSSRDADGPATPTGFDAAAGADTVTLSWNPVSDPSGVRYHVLREDRAIAVTTDTSVTVPAGDSQRYFVRAADGAGNLSASTPVLDVGDLPANQAPTAAFNASADGLTVTLDGSASDDADGSVVAHDWDLGDGSTASGTVVEHTFTEAGDYDVTLAVTDDEGATGSVTTTVSVVEPPAAMVGPDAVWQWHYEAGAPGDGWNDRNFDASGWHSGQGRLGWGSDGIVTDIDTFADPLDRPRAAFFRHEFAVVDPGEFVSVDITGIADDGAIFYVNGVEVARQNMADREGTHLTYAPSARRVWVAEDDPVFVSVPADVLVAGTNVVAASTHVNFRRTHDLTFELEVTGVTNTEGEEP